MCAALACPTARASPRDRLHAAGGAVRPEALSEIGPQEHADGDRQGIRRVWTAVFSAAASELAERRMDTTESVVRGARAPGFARGRAKVGIASQPACHCWRSLSGRYFSITVSNR